MPDTQLFNQKRKFIIRLGKALHQFGTPAYRLEAHLQAVTQHLGLSGSFIASPTALTFVLYYDEDQEYNHLARVKPGDLDLGALARTDELVDELINGNRDLDDALLRLEEIKNKPPQYSKWLNFIAFSASSGAFAMLVNTSWHDAIASAMLGIWVYCLILLAERTPRFAPMLEPFAALSCAVIAYTLSQFYMILNIPVVILSGIIAFIPGLALTLGLAELSNRDLISGTARVMDAFMLLFKLYFGAMLGMMIGQALFGVQAIDEHDFLPQWAHLISVPILSMTLVVLFKARPKDAIWGIFAGVIAFGVSAIAAKFVEPSISIFFGALAVGIYANIYSIVLNAPPSIALLQGIVILVPGSKTYIGLNGLISGQTMLEQTNLGAQIFVIFMSLIAGLIFANAIIPPRKSL
ncbi:threonine/serine ThrE exporter family protein [Shewanella marina]|uniref:threonine/serine ThrE exporter family protein n=1 Tax=Shewanella marina TaxID=487319 RepID=UPI00046E5D83|nr:threonine/serine exporter family protein [Shewanella marina]